MAKTLMGSRSGLRKINGKGMRSEREEVVKARFNEVDKVMTHSAGDGLLRLIVKEELRE